MIQWEEIRTFYFIWPGALLLFIFIPIGWIFYARQQQAKLQKLALHFSYTAIAHQLKNQPKAWKRLLQPIIISIITVCFIVSLARPTLTAKVPINSVDMLLVFDISLSMLATDIKPNRMEAAKQAAIRFVKSLPRDTRIGLEFFAGDNYVLSPPTSQHNEVIDYLRALKKEDLKTRTEIGSALHTALKLLETNTQSPSPPTNPPKKEPERVIILMSDGDSHEGYPWNLAAQNAKAHRVIIHTVGVGSAEGGVITYQGVELPVNFDESTLRQIAEMTDGQYFRVFKEADFKKVYEQIQERTLHYEERELDLSFILAAFGLLTLAIALLLQRKL